MRSERIGFSKWQADDIELAKTLWGNDKVTKYICANGRFSENDIIDRLNLELQNDAAYGLQYWPMFNLATEIFIGCCGLRPYKDKILEIGFHLRPEFWRKGYAIEAANTVIGYAFSHFRAEALFAGHNPQNLASQKVLFKLGFTYVGDEFYAPTGLYHPSYILKP